jgi:hypothetical protein
MLPLEGVLHYFLRSTKPSKKKIFSIALCEELLVFLRSFLIVVRLQNVEHVIGPFKGGKL